jgi:hypothetical protein
MRHRSSHTPVFDPGKIKRMAAPRDLVPGGVALDFCGWDGGTSAGSGSDSWDGGTSAGSGSDTIDFDVVC